MLKSLRNLFTLKRSNNKKNNTRLTRSKTRSTRSKTRSNKQKCRKKGSKCSIYEKNQCCKTLRCLYPNEKG